MFMHPVASQSSDRWFPHVVALSCWLMAWSASGIAEDDPVFPKAEVGRWTIEQGRIPESEEVGKVGSDYCFMYQTPVKDPAAHDLNWVGDPVPLFFSRLTIDGVPALVMSMNKSVFDGASNGLSVKVNFDGKTVELDSKEGDPMVLYAMMHDEKLMDGGGEVLEPSQTISAVDGWLRNASTMTLLASVDGADAATNFQFQVSGTNSSTGASNTLDSCLAKIGSLVQAN